MMVWWFPSGSETVEDVSDFVAGRILSWPGDSSQVIFKFVSLDVGAALSVLLWSLDDPRLTTACWTKTVTTRLSVPFNPPITSPSLSWKLFKKLSSPDWVSSCILWGKKLERFSFWVKAERFYSLCPRLVSVSFAEFWKTETIASVKTFSFSVPLSRNVWESLLDLRNFKLVLTRKPFQKIHEEQKFLQLIFRRIYTKLREFEK